MKKFHTIKTKRLILKKHSFDIQYATQYFQLIQNDYEYLTVFLDNMLKVKKVEDELSFFKTSSENWDAQKEAHFAIWCQKTHQILGAISVFDINWEDKSAEIGYFLFQKNQGNGFISEALRAVEEEFWKRGIERLQIRTDSQNKKSQKVAVQNGYTFEGNLRKSKYSLYFNELRDFFVYSKLKNEAQNEKQ